MHFSFQNIKYLIESKKNNPEKSHEILTVLFNVIMSNYDYKKE